MERHHFRGGGVTGRRACNNAGGKGNKETYLKELEVINLRNL